MKSLIKERQYLFLPREVIGDDCHKSMYTHSKTVLVVSLYAKFCLRNTLVDLATFLS